MCCISFGWVDWGLCPRPGLQHFITFCTDKQILLLGQLVTRLCLDVISCHVSSGGLGCVLYQFGLCRLGIVPKTMSSAFHNVLYR